jgi:hypothetical protein
MNYSVQMDMMTVQRAKIKWMNIRDRHGASLEFSRGISEAKRVEVEIKNG